jgi:hypothetical protein
MGTDIKQITVIPTTVLLLVTSLAVAARDYVPPPSGPYQSSVVINSSSDDDSQQQVYKFPPPDILLDESNTRSEFVNPPGPLVSEPQQQNAPVISDSLMNQQRRQPAVNSQGSRPMPDAYSQWQLPQQSGQVNPGTGWYGYQGQGRLPNYNQNVWQPAPGYGYQQQYPYSYGAPYQYNGNNSPFYGMPSPWNVTNKNPFFSDK